MKINLNDKVRVKLTEHGAKIYNDYVKKEKKTEDEELELSFWEFMYIFGQHTYIGTTRTVISNNEVEII